MTRGTAGYGRYDSDQAHVGCPWALASGKTSESPCIARDGRMAMTGFQCISCGNTLLYLFRDLADDYPPADLDEYPGSSAEAADLFRDLVYEATEPSAGGSDHEPGPAPGKDGP